MKEIIETLRKVLVSNSTVTATVSTPNIRSSYAGEVVDVPLIILGIDANSESFNPDGVNRCNVSVDIRTPKVDATNYQKYDAHDLYEKVHDALHNQEVSFTTTYANVHLCYEMSARDNTFDQGHDCYIIPTSFLCIYTTNNETIFSGVDGEIYGHATSVSTASANKIGEFSGGVSLRVLWNKNESRGLEMFPQSFDYDVAGALLSVSDITLDPDKVDLLYGVSSSSGTLNDGVTAATVRVIDQDISPQGIQLLFTMTRTDTGKRLEIMSYKGFCDALDFIFPKYGLSMTDCVFYLIGDPNNGDDVVKISEET